MSRYEKPSLIGSYEGKKESPSREKRKDMYNNTPKGYGNSLHEEFRNALIMHQNSRNRLKNADTRDTEIHNIVYKWRKAQITHSDLKKKPDLARDSIIKHASSWFREFVEQDMKDESIMPERKAEAQYIPTPEKKRRGWFGHSQEHSEASKKGWATRRKRKI